MLDMLAKYIAGNVVDVVDVAIVVVVAGIRGAHFALDDDHKTTYSGDDGKRAHMDIVPSDISVFGTIGALSPPPTQSRLNHAAYLTCGHKSRQCSRTAGRPPACVLSKLTDRQMAEEAPVL